MKRLISVAALSALLAVAGYASTSAFAANVQAVPATTTLSAQAAGPALTIARDRVELPVPTATPAPTTTPVAPVTPVTDPLIETPATEAAEPVEVPGTESATEPVETGSAADPAELAGDTGHADNPADPNANHEFDGTE